MPVGTLGAFNLLDPLYAFGNLRTVCAGVSFRARGTRLFRLVLVVTTSVVAQMCSRVGHTSVARVFCNVFLHAFQRLYHRTPGRFRFRERRGGTQNHRSGGYADKLFHEPLPSCNSDDAVDGPTLAFVIQPITTVSSTSPQVSCPTLKSKEINSFSARHHGRPRSRQPGASEAVRERRSGAEIGTCVGETLDGVDLQLPIA